MRTRLLTTFVLVAAALGLADSAQATTYTFTGGSVTLLGSDSGGTVLSTTIPLTGTQVTFNLPAETLTSFQFTAGPDGPLALTGNLHGEDITLTSGTVTPGSGYGPIAPTTGTNPYLFTVGPIAASATVSGTGLYVFGSTTVNGTNASLAGQITLSNPSTLTLNGITIGVFSLPVVGNVTLKADVIFQGVPEPGTALLLGSGLVALGAAARRRGLS
ncbi:MAG TPA: hypothetical protein DEP35_00630 [Deltaproteobacteria bacterium]|jgi:hypothetical protein|nr:hypothetical protein [Deltaproteobacteria bacterium]